MIEQAACVPYRVTDDGYEILLITTKKGKWTIPKGIIDPGETPPETAAKEAFEEAGVLGEIEDGVIGCFEYRKWGEELTVDVFLMRVEETVDDFEDADVRELAWLSPEDARRFVRKRLRGILKTAVGILDKRYGGP